MELAGQHLIEAASGQVQRLTGTEQSPVLTPLVEKILATIQYLSLTGTYSNIAPLKTLFRQIESEHGDDILEAVSRLMLLRMVNGDYWTPQCQVPEPIRSQFNSQCERICREATEAPLGFYNPFHDAFLKDFSILRGKTLALTTGIMDLSSVLWRRPLVTGPLVQRLSFLLMLLRKSRGTRPFFQHHTHANMLATFNEQGWRNNYHMMCDFLAANPGYKGFTGSSWFYDPVVATISPRLGYLAEEPLRGGAHRYLIGDDTSGNAISTSPTRKALYEKGQYRPRSYMLVWLRDDILRWGARNPKP